MSKYISDRMQKKTKEILFYLNFAGVTNVYNLNYMKVNDSEKKKNPKLKFLRFFFIITIIEIEKKRRDKLKCIKFLICMLL